MKWILYAICSLVLIGCNTDRPGPAGVWKSTSKFPQATYHVSERNGLYDCRVLDYYDGTSRYKSTQRQSWFLFKGAGDRTEETDGITGATKSGSVHSSPYSIKFIYPDTLQVETQIMGQIKREYWTRLKEEIL